MIAFTLLKSLVDLRNAGKHESMIVIAIRIIQPSLAIYIPIRKGWVSSFSHLISLSMKNFDAYRWCSRRAIPACNDIVYYPVERMHRAAAKGRIITDTNTILYFRICACIYKYVKDKGLYMKRKEF